MIPPPDLAFSLDAEVHRGIMQACVQAGDAVVSGQPIAEAEWQVLHSPLDGMVTVSDARQVIIQCCSEQPPWCAVPMPLTDKAMLPDYLRAMGLAGMGGGCFPYARRFARIPKTPLHTLVINAVECEPGVGIDESLMIHQSRAVFAGVEVFVNLLGLRRCVLAVRRSTRRHLEPLLSDHSFDWLEMPDRYPGGAGKLITAKLSGRMPPPGTLNTDLGYIISNVASLWAFGRRLIEGRPSVDRPLTLLAPDAPPLQLVVPLGVSAGHVLSACGVSFDAGRQVLVAEGRMMGRAVDLDFRVGKGTISLMVLNKDRRWEQEESPCILCGSCFDACPLGLHPIGIANRIRERRSSRSLVAQLNECFFCGACSAVCPADIPLVQIFREGKAWLKNKA